MWVLIRKEKLFYSGGWRLGEKVNSCPKTSSEDSAGAMTVFEGRNTWGAGVRVFVVFHSLHTFSWLVGGEVTGWCSRNLALSLELESCRSSIAVPQGGYIFVLKFYCNSPFYPLIKFCWSCCNHLLTSVFVSILSPSVNVKVLVTQLCQTLCDPINCSLTVSSVYGGLQARITEHQHMPMWCCCCSLAAHFRIFFSKLY